MQVSTTPATRKLVLGSTVAAVSLVAGTLVVLPAALRSMLSSNFLPHAYCYLYDKKLIALHVASDAVIWLSYVAISCTLVYLVWRTRREIPFSWMFLAFGLFIVACGFTHFMEIVVLWHPLYWLAGDVKLVTALASALTAITLPGLIPEIHNTVSAAQLSETRRLQAEKANAELQHLSSRVMSVQDEERRRIARELHDGIGQYLAAIKMSCEVAAQATPRGDAGDALRDCLGLIDRCTAEVRTLSHLLHPPLLEEMGLASAMAWYVDGFTQRSGIEVQLNRPPQGIRFARPLELALFRVLQESLTNIHRHSGSKVATVRLRTENGQAILTVEDQGKGIVSEEYPAKTGVGISGMRERVRELGGDLRLTSSPAGTRVEAILPLESEAK